MPQSWQLSAAARTQGADPQGSRDRQADTDHDQQDHDPRMRPVQGKDLAGTTGVSGRYSLALTSAGRQAAFVGHVRNREAVLLLERADPRAAITRRAVLIPDDEDPARARPQCCGNGGNEAERHPDDGHGRHRSEDDDHGMAIESATARGSLLTP